MKRLLSICIALVLTAACKGNDSSMPTTPTAPTTTTNTFTGTVAVGGRAMHSFTVAQPGQVSVTLTAASPPASVVLGLGIGLPGDSTCGLLPGGSTTASAGFRRAQLTGVLTPASFCVSVDHVGNQTAAVWDTVDCRAPVMPSGDLPTADPGIASLAASHDIISLGMLADDVPGAGVTARRGPPLSASPTSLPTPSGQYTIAASAGEARIVGVPASRSAAIEAIRY